MSTKDGLAFNIYVAIFKQSTALFYSRISFIIVSISLQHFLDSFILIFSLHQYKYGQLLFQPASNYYQFHTFLSDLNFQYISVAKFSVLLIFTDTIHFTCMLFSTSGYWECSYFFITCKYFSEIFFPLLSNQGHWMLA